MKPLYIIQTTIYNGTVALQHHTDAFLDNKLAERTLKAMDEANKYCPYRTSSKLEEITLFETESEVAILREMENNDPLSNGDKN